jgi:hypothetical protein
MPSGSHDGEGARRRLRRQGGHGGGHDGWTLAQQQPGGPEPALGSVGIAASPRIQLIRR